jgi:hypothetical protein
MGVYLRKTHGRKMEMRRRFIKLDIFGNILVVGDPVAVQRSNNTLKVRRTCRMPLVSVYLLELVEPDKKGVY